MASIEARIAQLLEQAAPLRELDDDSEAKVPLAGIVDEINALRALQAKGRTEFEYEDEEEPSEPDAPAPKRRGRPPKIRD